MITKIFEMEDSNEQYSKHGSKPKSDIGKQLLWAFIGALIGVILTIAADKILTAITTGYLEGTVFEKAKNTPLDSVFISVGDQYFTKTDSNGHFKIPKIHNNTYKVVISKEDYLTTTADITISGNSVKNFTIEKNVPTATITAPRDNDSVRYLANISGNAENVPSDKYIWIVTKPIDSDGYWPQGAPVNVNPNDYTWTSTAYIGRTGSMDVGKKFTIFVVLCDAQGNEIYKQYLDHGRISNEHPAIPLPPHTIVLAQVTVTRQ